MSRNIDVLVVEDSEDDYLLLVRELGKGGYTVNGNRVETAEDLSKALEDRPWDLIISDNNLPNLNAPKALEISRGKSIAPFIIVSGTISEDDAVNAMRMGASDYVFKGNLSRLLPALRRELEDSENRKKREEAERALLKSEEQFKNLSQSIGDVFFALNNDLHCTYWNLKAEEITSTKATQALGKSFEELFPHLPSNGIETVKEALKRAKKISVTLEVAKQNDITFLEMNCYPYSQGVSVIMKDITKAKRTAYKLKKVNKELETFMYRLSHDLKGPVSSMIGLVELAKKDLKGRTANQYCNMLEGSAKNLREVLGNLLDVTKIKTGDINLTDVSLASIAEKVVVRIQHRVNKRNAKITLPEGDLVIYSDNIFIGSIIQNLMENAIKYGGSETQQPAVSLSWSQTEKETIISVSDNGPGIPKSFRNKIFEMFYRANETKSGSGLGLYIVKSAVEAIGGSISLKSTTSGTTFKVVLPKYAN